MNKSFLDDCLNLLMREDIKQNIKEALYPIIQPIITILLSEIYLISQYYICVIL